MRRVTPRIVLALLAITTIAAAPGQLPAPKTGFLPANSQIGNYVAQDVMIPMRDGVALHAEIWRPKDATGPLPILMQRSPYGFELPTVQRYFSVQFKELMAERFIFLLEDIRGRFGSQGSFVMLRPKSSKPGGIDEATDTYDTIDWAIHHVANNNGRVGIFGVSYLGWTTAMSTIHPHPALKAISVQASPEDMFIGDDFHHNGAFRLDYGWEYAAALESNGRTMKPFSFGKDDPYDWYLKQSPLAGLDVRSVSVVLPTWQNFATHPSYDSFWQVQATTAQMPAHVTVPDLIVAGWWDQEDFYGPLTIFRREQARDPDNLSSIVIGPWNHGGWAKGDGRSYGPFDFGAPTGNFFRASVEMPWFKYWLKGEGMLDQPKALIFETGSNRWHSYAAWPPRDRVERRALYFHAGGRLSFDPPKPGEDEPDTYRSDPAHPVPYRARPIVPMESRKSTWPEWLADDQAPFAKRADVLSWQTDALTSDVTVRGDVLAKLFARTTGSDADWIVKLIDVYPSNAATPQGLRSRQLIIADDVFRGRFRKSLVHPQAIVPGKVLDYAIDLHSASHVFKKGHRIAVQVQSTWFPLIDRNPQIFVPNIFKARADQYTAQTHAIFHSVRYPSAIELDLAANDDAHKAAP